MAYIDGYVATDYKLTKVVYLLIIGSITNFVTTTTVQLAYRIMVTFDSSHVLFKLCEPKKFILTSMLVFVSMTAFLFTPIAMDKPMGEGLKDLVITDFPALGPVFEKHPYTMGYLPGHEGGIRFANKSFFIASCFMVPMVAMLTILMLKRLIEIKKSLHKQKYNLHAMLSSNPVMPTVHLIHRGNTVFMGVGVTDDSTDKIELSCLFGMRIVE
uniref:G protein-coupled receptor n=1 Tax=Panagrellus redivivus TaxID=6233 RepID=A0A7E4V5H2_PANRE